MNKPISLNSDDRGAVSIARTPTLARVIARQEVAPRHFHLTLDAPTIATQARAGQFVHVLPRSSSCSDPFLRRAFSIMAVDDDSLELLFRVEGRGTQNIAAARPGEFLDLLGPLGQPFDLRMFHVKQTVEATPLLATPLLVGGGIGVPPLVFLARTLLHTGFSPRIFVGARTSGEVIGEDQFNAMGIKPAVTTDDGSCGQRGFITGPLEVALTEITDRAERTPIIYACGPAPMLKAVAAVAARFQAPCQVSLEENMPCGIGVCNGCVVATKSSGSDYERYQRVCVHGPAMWASEIDWEAF